MTVIRNITIGYSRRRFACLFFTLLISMVAAPVLREMEVGTGFMEAFLTFNILAAVFITLLSLGSHVGMWLLALALAGRGGHALFDYDPLLMTSHGIGAVICLVSVCVMLRFVLGEGPVTTERIFAALDVYLLVGVMCGLFFCIFEERWPGSFSFQGSSFAGGHKDPLANTIYFSFVTLGTLGYGDVIPVGGAARALAVAESIGAQMYLVVVVARLVSLYKGGTEHNDGN